MVSTLRRLSFVFALFAVVIYASWSLFTFGVLIFFQPHATRHACQFRPGRPGAALQTSDASDGGAQNFPTVYLLPSR